MSIGRLDGFRLRRRRRPPVPKPSTLAGAAQKALAGEIDARATKLAAGPDEQLVLASDGSDPLARRSRRQARRRRRSAAPRVRIIADEHLTGAPRDAVQARLDLWLKTHIEKLLAPLFHARRGRGRHRHGARRRVPAHRVARRAGAPEGRRGRQGPRPAVPRGLAQIRCAVRRLSHLYAGAAEADAAGAGDAALCAQA